MNTKKIAKKLELNRETLVNLDRFKMKEVKGGETHLPPTYTLITCPHCDTDF